MMDIVPRLIPSWHDIALQDCIRQKFNFKFSSLYPPDYGGIGLDVNINDEVHCRIPKYTKCQIRFAADKCSLPFFPLRKIKNLTEPCLKDLKEEKLDFDKFSLKLTNMRTTVSNKKVCSNLTSLQNEINAYIDETQEKDLYIRAPNSVLHLAKTLPKRTIIPSYNVSYAGGTLAASMSSEKLNLLHPSSKNLSKLCTFPLLVGNEQHYMPDLSERKIVNLGKEPILQIESAKDGFCCVRQANTFHLVNSTNMNVFSKKIHKLSLFHIASSPYNHMEMLSVYEKGIMKLRNMDINKTVWSISEDMYENSYILYPTWRCSFGSHPFSALSLNEKKLHCFDFREKKITARQIFSIVNNSCYVGEELVGMKQWNKNPFQHLLTSNHHLIICDERYSKTPVMYWNHCLKNSPVYLDYADFDSDVSIIVIGSQGTQQLASFLCSHQEKEIQPVSLSTPLLLSSPRDCINSLKFHCHYVDDKVSTRFSSPLTGLCVIPNNKEIGFTVLQSTSVGDIFYQDFKQSSTPTEKTYNVSIGCVLTPPEKILPHLTELLSDRNENEEIEEANEAVSRTQINIDKILNLPKEISANCMLCRLNSVSDDKKLILSETCPTCNLTSAESQRFSKALANDSVVIGPASEELGLDCDFDYLSKFEDQYSKKILSLWLESDNPRDWLHEYNLNTEDNMKACMMVSSFFETM